MYLAVHDAKASDLFVSGCSLTILWPLCVQCLVRDHNIVSLVTASHTKRPGRISLGSNRLSTESKTFWRIIFSLKNVSKNCLKSNGLSSLN